MHLIEYFLAASIFYFSKNDKAKVNVSVGGINPN